MQRTLASKSLEEGQLGVVFAAFLKLLVPFVVIIPGILAYNLYRDDLASLADKNTAEVVKIAEKSAADSGKQVIYNLNASRLVRTEGRGEALTWLSHNARVCIADDAELGAVLDRQLQLVKVLNSSPDDVGRCEAAEKLIALDKEVTGEAQLLDANKYVVTSSLAAYHYDSAFATLLKKLLPGTG